MLLSLGNWIPALVVAGQPGDGGRRADGSHAEVKAFALFFSPHKAFVSPIENLHKSTIDLVNNRLLKISTISAALVSEGRSLATVK